jgi:hemerythrin-like metal-binding protein
MPLITWSDKYSVQIGLFDEQHKKLIGYINELHEAMRQRKGKDVIPGILQNLISYTKVHFTKEEEIMKKHAYPGYGAQKEAHDKFIAKLDEFRQELNKGSLSVPINVMSFMETWLINHIQVMDKKYGPFLGGKEVQ